MLFLPLYAFRDMYGLRQYMLLISMISTEFMAIGVIDKRVCIACVADRWFIPLDSRG